METNCRPDWASFFALDVEVCQKTSSLRAMTRPRNGASRFAANRCDRPAPVNSYRRTPPGDAPRRRLLRHELIRNPAPAAPEPRSSSDPLANQR